MTQLCSQPISLLTTLPYVPRPRSHEHIREALLAIGENSRSPLIDDIVVLLDKGGPPLRDSIIAEQRKRGHNVSNVTKVRTVVYGRQPTYSDLFRFASVHLAKRAVALLNADVVLRNLHLIDHQALKSKVALVLPVRPPSGAFKCAHDIPDRCNRSTWRFAGGSWDVEIFWSPLQGAQYDLLDVMPPAPVYMNEQGAENRVGYFLTMSGYDVQDPCYNNLTEHWHCSVAHTHHSKRNVYVTSDAVNKKGVFTVPSVDTRGICTF